MAVAALDSTVEQCDDLIAACLQLNPGAGAWLIEQLADRRPQWEMGARSPIDLASSPQRMLRAARTWIDALGPLAVSVLPVAGAALPIRLGVRVVDQSVEVAWSQVTPESDEVVELTEEVDRHGLGTEWRCLTWGLGVGGPQWPWIYVRDMVARSTLPLFEKAHLIGPPSGIWHLERSYRTARVLVKGSALRRAPLDRVALIELADERLKQAEGSVRASWRTGAGVIDSRELADLVEFLATQESVRFFHPLPEPDIEHPSVGLVCNFFSQDRMALFCAEMLDSAVSAYEDMCTTLFASFSWSLGRHAMGPLGVLAEVAYTDASDGYDEPMFEYELVPLDLLDSYIQKDSSLIVSENLRAAVNLVPSEKQSTFYGARRNGASEVSEWIRRSGVKSPFVKFGVLTSTVIECGHDRPASLMAAGWMYDDLKALNLGGGSFPQLNSW